MDNIQVVVDFLHKRLKENHDSFLEFEKGINVFELPGEFLEYCELNSFRWNYLKVELITGRKRGAWVGHSTVGLKSFTVCDVFFAVNPSDRRKKLADLEFVWNSKKGGPVKTRFNQMHHMSFIAMDAKKHSMFSCRHRVIGMPVASLRLTMMQRGSRGGASRRASQPPPPSVVCHRSL